jgi:hypothetical protein
METRYSWNEAKRQTNLRKHGLDFANANEVLESTFRLDVELIRNGERRVQSVSYVLGLLAVLTVVHTRFSNDIRIISFRRASQQEREVYYAWLENEDYDA